MEKYFSKIFFILAGLLSLFTLFDSTKVRLRLGTFNWAEALLQFSVVFMMFAWIFLDSHLKSEDERAKVIKYRASFYSLVAIMIQLFILMNGIIWDLFYLESRDLILFIISLVTITNCSFQLFFVRKL